MYKLATAALTAGLALTTTPAHADQSGMYTDVSFAQCVYTNRAHTEYTTTRDVAITNTGTTLDRVRVTITTDGAVTRRVYVVLSENARVDLFVPVKAGQVKDVTVKYRGGRSEIFRLRHHSVCG